MNIGHHLILGFEGTTPRNDFLRLLREEQIGGVILFARNVESREQLQDLIARLKDARGDSLLLSVDHEGGRVFRLPAPFTPIPPARVFGKYYERSADLNLIEEIAFLMAVELRSAGFNLNYAPVLDVDSCRDNPIIGDRSFHSDPEVVTALGVAFIKGFERGGLISCGKHFPGHGDTSEDSHLTLPLVARSRQDLEDCELIPFAQAIAAGVPTLMTAHVLYTELDPDCCATHSPSILRELLRQRLGFEGVVFSDDLFMKGIAPNEQDVPQATVQALHAGCDMLLLCHETVSPQQILDHLKREVDQSSELQEALAESAPRVRQLLDRVKKQDTEGTRLAPEAGELVQKLAQLSP